MTTQTTEQTTEQAKHTCIICNKPYSSTKKHKIIAAMHRENLCIISYPHTCLACIQQEMQAEKDNYINNIQAASEQYSRARLTYNKALTELRQAQVSHQNLKQKYEHLDKQAALLDFFIHKNERTLKPKGVPKTRHKKSLSEVQRLLAQLSPKQQAALREKIAQL